MFKILVVDDDSGLRLSVKSTLQAAGKFEVDEAFDGMNAVEKVKETRYNAVLLDVDMPRMSGLEALKAIKEHDPSIIVIIMTAYATIDDAVQAVRDGAYNYVSKPVKGEELVSMVEKASMAHNLISDVAASAPILHESGRKIIGNTAQMQKVYNIINRLSKVDTPVLIRGASGTGKELVARAIHHNSGNKEGKFVALNCSAIPENLFESELFGHEKGAFTGADQRKIGKFQYAEGGTVFLDEVGDMPILMQVKLLRVLQEKMFTPVGANREIETNVRIIAATNRPLEDMIKKGTFREDLYYRLNVMPIFLPSLAERSEDIDHLVNTFVKKFNQAHGKKIIGTTPSAMAALKKYNWPGNIRELENVIEHAFILEESNQLTIHSFPEPFLRATGIDLDSHQIEILAPMAAGGNGNGNGNGNGAIDEADSDSEDIVTISGDTLDFNRHKEAFEKEFIIKALKTFKGRINQTALHANIPKKTLLRKIEKYGIVAKDYAE
ncbi:MAG: sigma-54-dependent Fis family transcriptional regulator [Bdellovibrionaceae bacterium]|nr:sigma-54-dependent Fis family transcriptional regulator [Bdellovibrionales bacterium]MCB9086490.1 sigma-54-dependent Fis family transcriptional regulator [Pseudobdellovibrionaceae bacterium]